MTRGDSADIGQGVSGGHTRGYAPTVDVHTMGATSRTIVQGSALVMAFYYSATTSTSAESEITISSRPAGEVTSSAA